MRAAIIVLLVAGTAWAGQGKRKSAAKLEPPPVEQAAPEQPAPEQPVPELPPHVEGPKLVELGNHITIDLPAGMMLLERDEAQKMLAANGDATDNVIAVVFKPDAKWLVVIDYEDVGYVNDGDADELDADQ